MSSRRQAEFQNGGVTSSARQARSYSSSSIEDLVKKAEAAAKQAQAQAISMANLLLHKNSSPTQAQFEIAVLIGGFLESTTACVGFVDKVSLSSKKYPAAGFADEAADYVTMASKEALQASLDHIGDHPAFSREAASLGNSLLKAAWALDDASRACSTQFLWNLVVVSTQLNAQLVSLSLLLRNDAALVRDLERCSRRCSMVTHEAARMARDGDLDIADDNFLEAGNSLTRATEELSNATKAHHGDDVTLGSAFAKVADALSAVFIALLQAQQLKV